MPLLSVGQIKLSNGGYQQEALSSEVCGASAELKTKVKLAPAEPFSMGLIRDEFLNYSYKYMGLIDRTLQQLQSELKKTPISSVTALRALTHTNHGIMDMSIVVNYLFHYLL